MMNGEKTRLISKQSNKREATIKKAYRGKKLQNHNRRRRTGTKAKSVIGNARRI